MFHSAYRFDQISMGFPVKIKNLSNGRAPSIVKHICFFAIQIPKHRAVNVTIKDLVDVCFGTATCVREFLNKFIAALYVAGTLFHDVLRQ